MTSSPAPAWPKAVLHLDMDAFYVNVHCLEHPTDQGIPLVVGGRPNQRGVVASASYEARQFGIRSAMPTATAVRLCPQLKMVPANWTRIRDCSRQIMVILAEFGPVEKMSVDEAYVDLSAWPDPALQAEAIRTAVKVRTSLPCSVGLATSKLVAKVASDFDKPEGFTVIGPGEEADFLAPQPVRAIWGIGPKTAAKLAALGIERCGQLAAADPGQLHAFGRQADSLIRRAQGIDEREVEAERGLPKSISQEWTFSQDVRDPVVLRAQLRQMADSVAASLQKRRLIASTIKVKFRWADFTTFTRQKTIEVGTDDAATIYHHALLLWEENWTPEQSVRLLGVGVSSLRQTAERQLGFNF